MFITHLCRIQRIYTECTKERVLIGVACSLLSDAGPRTVHLSDLFWRSGLFLGLKLALSVLKHYIFLVTSFSRV